jgi:hypothetical protein
MMCAGRQLAGGSGLYQIATGGINGVETTGFTAATVYLATCAGVLCPHNTGTSMVFCNKIPGCWVSKQCRLTLNTFTAKVDHSRFNNSCLTLSLLMSYIYGAACKARNFNVVYIWIYIWQRWKPYLSISCKMFQHWINAEGFPVSQLCVNTLPATKITLIINGIFNR